jgi:hypothetical protein
VGDPPLAAALLCIYSVPALCEPFFAKNPSTSYPWTHKFETLRGGSGNPVSTYPFRTNMAATTTNPFPLATEQPFPGDAPPSGADANAVGASGSSPGAVELSRGALIAIIVVVCVVGVGGSE